MVDTIKFSQMTNAGNINNNDIMPSLRSAENVILNNPWTFLPQGTTAQRPAPSSTINYRLRFNTDDQLYEYYDALTSMWIQLTASATVAGPFVIYTADATLPGAQNLGLLSNGILKQTISSASATLNIAVNGTDYYGPGFVIPGTDGGTGINNGSLTINLGSAVVDYVLTSDSLGNATWQPTSASGAITTIDGDSGSATPTAGVVSIEAASTGLSFTGSGSILSLGGILDLANGGTNANLTATVNNLVYSTASALALLATASNGALVTSAGGVPSISTVLPAGMTIASNPSTGLGIATKQYVDTTALNGTSVYAASAGTLGTVTQSGAGVGATLTNAGAQATFALDGVNPPVGTNVLIKNTATGMTTANEGIYEVTSVGSGASNWVLTRATSYDTAIEINNTGLIVIQNGSTLAGTAWYNTATIATVDTTSFNYLEFGSTPTASLFNAYLTADQTNVTGDGTTATVICDHVVVDRHSDYNASTGVFTAPVSGLYEFTLTISSSTFAANNTGYNTWLVDNAGTIYTLSTIPVIISITGTAGLTFMDTRSTNMELTAGQTIKAQYAVSGHVTKNISIEQVNAPTNRGTVFSGYLVA